MPLIGDGLTRYRSDDEDSARWLRMPLRPGDIVISTRSKSGTTWMQLICTMLVLGTPELPGRLDRLSPWLDWLGTPIDDVVAELESQEHRRVIKSHTPLDGIPSRPDVSYLVVGRHPLDAAVSLYHQGANLDRERLRKLTGATPPERTRPREDLTSWLRRWITRDVSPQGELDSLPGFMWHLGDAWRRRAEPNVTLVHYDDLLADLGGELARIAARLGIALAAPVRAQLVEAASFATMRASADELAPDAGHVLLDRAAFFRRGRSGAGREALGDPALARYHRRAAELAPPGLLAWLHRDG